MKSVIFLAVLAIFVSVCVAVPATFSFSGSTQSDQPNVGVYGGIDLYGDSTPCYIEETDPDQFDYNYVAFNIWVDASNASYYFVRAHAQNYTDTVDPDFEVFIYTSFNPNLPCNNLYYYGEFENYVDNLYIFDGVNLVAGAYTIVVTTEDEEAVWAIEFSPAVTVIPLTPNGLQYDYYAGPAHYYPDYPEQNNCSVDDYGTHDNPAIYNTFVWTQQSSGYFDIYGIAINSSQINATAGGSYAPYLSLYAGLLTSNQTDFSINPCQPNFITGTEDGSVVAGLDYVWLNAGWNYTLVVSLQIFGSVAVQVVPSTVWFVSGGNSSFTPATYDTNNEADCTPDTAYTTSWLSLTVTAWNPVFIVAATHPLNLNQFETFTADLYLYAGNKGENPPETCSGLLQFNNGYGLGQQVKVGTNYTVVIADYYDDTNLNWVESAVHVFVLTGTYVNTAPFVFPPTTTGGATVGTSSSSGTTTSRTTTGSAGAVTGNGATTGVSPSTTGVRGTTGSTTGAKATTGTTGLRATTSTTGLKGTGSTTGGQNANSASTTAVSVFASLLVILALLF